MSTDPDNPRPSFRFRDKFSRLKDRVKDKLKDKAIRHNATLIVHQNLTLNDTTNDYSHGSRHGFRQQMHHFKDVLKNKTHYESIKHKIKDKFDIHDNKTYPKGFYDSIFSPETENDVYLKTAIICLWVIALLCIIPTIIVIFLPAKKKQRTATSINMIFFHVFLCEIFYLSYILLAMINVAKDFRLGASLCDFANYGMYVTIPIMQFTLLFLSLERLSKHFNFTMTWAKIFTKPYLIQVILCIIWIILIALLVTFMFIKKQFTFNFIRDRIEGLAPPIVGDVVDKLASRRHHCSIDGRLSSVFKTIIIVLFVILIVKPILISLGFSILTPFCCKNRRKEVEKYGDRRTTRLVTIFLLLNLFFSFPFYFASMFNSILTNIDSTKDTFNLILKICFILRIVTIIFECLAFYIFERNSWSLLSKLLYYATCKKCPMFNRSSDDDLMYSKDPDVQDLINQTRDASDDDDDDEGQKKKKKKRTVKRKPEPKEESQSGEDEDEDDDGALKKKTKKKIVEEKVETPDESEENDDEEEVKPVTKRTKRVNKKTVEIQEEDEPKKFRTKKGAKEVESDDEEEEEEEDEPKQKPTSKRKSQKKRQQSDEENETKHVTTTKRKSRTKKYVSDDDDEEEEERETTTTTKRKSRPKLEEEEEEEEEEEVIIEQPRTKSRHHDLENRIPNGQPTSHRHSSAVITSKTTKPVQRHSTPAVTNTKHRQIQPSSTPDESEGDTASNASHASAKMIKPSASPKPIRKQRPKNRPTSNEPNRSRTVSPSEKRSRHRADPSPSTRHKTKPSHSHHTKTKYTHTKKSTTDTKKPKKDRRIRILEMSDEV